MNRRTALHETLVDILGSRNVYFQPPASVKMNYPCIVYQRSRAVKKSADDSVYNYRWGYLVTVIDPNPDSTFLEQLVKLPLCQFDRHYTADNLNHDVFLLYY